MSTARQPPAADERASGSPDVDSPAVLCAAVACTVFVTLTAMAMLGPLLVGMADAWRTTVPVVAQLATAAATAWAVTALLAGPVSDAYGRRPVLLAGALLIAVASIGTALAPDVASAAGFRILAGLGGGMLLPTGIALVGDVMPAERRATGVAVVTTQPGLSSVVGVPLVTLAAAAAGWRAAFAVVGAAMLACSVALWRWTPRSTGPRTRPVLGARLVRVGRSPFAWFLVATNFAARATYGLVVIFFPPFLQEVHGLDTAELALPVAIVAVGTTVGLYLGGRIGKSSRRLFVAEAVTIAAALPGLAAFTLDSSLWLTVAATGLFMVFGMPLATLTYVVGTEVGGPLRGTLAGLLSGSGYASYAIGAAGGGLAIARFGYAAASIGLLLALLASGICLPFLLHGRTLDRARQSYAQVG